MHPAPRASTPVGARRQKAGDRARGAPRMPGAAVAAVGPAGGPWRAERWPQGAGRGRAPCSWWPHSTPSRASRAGRRAGGKERVSTTASQVCEKQLGGFLTAVETESWPGGPCSAGAARWGDRSPQGTATASPRASLRKPTGSHRSHGRAPSPRRSTMRTS